MLVREEPGPRPKMGTFLLTRYDSRASVRLDFPAQELG